MLSNRGKRTPPSLLASMSAEEGMGARRWRWKERSAAQGLRDLRIEKVLVPSSRRGQIAVMDDLRAHKGERVRELIEGRGGKLSYLPPYSSPELNRIEEAFSNREGHHWQGGGQKQGGFG